MTLPIENRTVYFIKEAQSKEVIGCYSDRDLAQKVVLFVQECSEGRFQRDLYFGIEGYVAETVAIDSGRFLVRGEKSTRVVTQFHPESCIQYVDRLEKKQTRRVDTVPVVSLEQISEGTEEQRTLWDVQARTFPFQKWERLGFCSSKGLAQRVENFVRDCAFERLPGGLDITVGEDPYRETVLKIRDGWRLKEAPQGRICKVWTEFCPKDCIEAVQTMVSTRKHEREESLTE